MWLQSVAAAQLVWRPQSGTIWKQEPRLGLCPYYVGRIRELKLANAAITDMQMRQRDVAALDEKYTKELANAKAENDALRDDVAAGRRRLHIKAVCQSVREATTASGVDNAASPRLADTAERDYFTLRERLVMMQAQLEGAQQYITEQCLK